jgi:acyl carrier protein
MVDKEKKIKTIIAEKLGVASEKVTPQARLVEDLQADQSDKLELLMAFDDAFDIGVRPASAANLHKVQDVFDYLADKV